MRKQPNRGVSRRKMLSRLGLGSAAGLSLFRTHKAMAGSSVPPQAPLDALYHEMSSIVGGQMKGDWQIPPAPDEAPTDHDEEALIQLPKPNLTHPGLPVIETFQTRRSVRSYATEPISMEVFSLILHTAQGVTQSTPVWGGRTIGLRAAPSAGALYPIDTHVVVNRVEDLEPGLYRYHPNQHALTLVEQKQLGAPLAQACLNQSFIEQAACVIGLTAVFARTQARYRHRAYRYVMLDAGHIGENIYLAGTALGLGVCGIGAFDDQQVNTLLKVDGKQKATVYLLTVGPKA